MKLLLECGDLSPLFPPILSAPNVASAPPPTRSRRKAAINRRIPKRPGFTLVELLTVITGLTVVLGGAAVLMQFLLGVSGEVRDRTHTVVTLGRLAEQFRQDAHNARGEPRIAADEQAVAFDLPAEGPIRWAIDEHGDLCRWENAGSKAARQNTYRLPKGTTATYELQGQGPARIVALRIVSPDAVGPTLTIEAFVGRDDKLAMEEKK
jgi:type II secretory pathway pseudopilin PulG